MKHFCLPLLLAGLNLVPVAVLAQETESPPVTDEKKIYKQVQPDGSVIYTDRPADGAVEVPVQKLPTYAPPQTPQFTPYEPARESQAQSPPYEFKISSPQNDESIRENTGNITVSVVINPALRIGHWIEYRLDGELIQSSQQTSVQLNNVDRGTHTVNARVLNAAGEVLADATSTFHLQRTSILQPGRTPPPAPKPTP